MRACSYSALIYHIFCKQTSIHCFVRWNVTQVELIPFTSKRSIYDPSWVFVKETFKKVFNSKNYKDNLYCPIMLMTLREYFVSHNTSTQINPDSSLQRSLWKSVGRNYYKWYVSRNTPSLRECNRGLYTRKWLWKTLCHFDRYHHSSFQFGNHNWWQCPFPINLTCRNAF